MLTVISPLALLFCLSISADAPVIFGDIPCFITLVNSIKAAVALASKKLSGALVLP
jgi:hypothetical protein